MTAAASHPELYDALREAGASEGRARAAERATLSADQAATKSEVREKVSEEIRPVDRHITKLMTTATIIGGLVIATFFFAVSAWLNAKHVADSLPDIRASISANARAIAENKAAIESNAAAIAANAAAIAENRAAIQANSEKLDQLALNQEEILRLLRIAKTE